MIKDRDLIHRNVRRRRARILYTMPRTIHKQPQPRHVELVCPAGTLAALRAAVDHGADAVYLGFRGETNTGSHPGLNFNADDASTGIDYAHASGARVFITVDTHPLPHDWPQAIEALELAVRLGADALVVADPGLMAHAARHHPQLQLHLSVHGSAINPAAIQFHRRQFNIRRIILPQLISSAQILQLARQTPIELAAFVFGNLCVMLEGRCALSSYATGRSPNTHGVCAPAHAVRWREDAARRQSRLNGSLIECHAPGEPVAHPLPCKGRYRIEDDVFHALEEPGGLNALDVLPDLIAAGIRAIKVEGRQRPASHVAQVTKLLRGALDECLRDPGSWSPPQRALDGLDALAGGSTHGLGSHRRCWQ